VTEKPQHFLDIRLVWFPDESIPLDLWFSANKILRKSRDKKNKMRYQEIVRKSINMTAGPLSGSPLCAFTVDVEDWYQSCIDFDAPITERVVKNTERILAILDRRNVKATFFVQGRVAETFPHLLQHLVAEGHEIQSHGYSHRPVNKMDRKELRLELDLARKTIEDACGVQVTAFRAPDFTIDRENIWALEVLVETGFTVDSSIFPIKTRRYGISGYPTVPHWIQLPNGAGIMEVPVAIWSSGKIRIPVAGGGYFRLIPGILLEKFFASMMKQQPVIIYCHPYEFNARELEEYYRMNVSKIFLLTQGLGRTSHVRKINNLLHRLPFGRFDQVMETWRLNENHLSND
jgi:polysaccharide deacetylase family protein (PEP-CTERM system associated)